MLLKEILRKTKEDKENKWTLTLNKYHEDINFCDICDMNVNEDLEHFLLNAKAQKMKETKISICH